MRPLICSSPIRRLGKESKSIGWRNEKWEKRKGREKKARES